MSMAPGGRIPRLRFAVADQRQNPGRITDVHRRINYVNMEILLLGTAAAESWPAPFCRCDACVQARKLGGKNIRTRSGALIDGTVKVDFGPDTYSQMHREALDLGSITTLVFTHEHDDHF